MKGFCDKSNWSCQDPAASSPWQESQVCCGGRLEICRTARLLEGLHFNTDKVEISKWLKFKYSRFLGNLLHFAVIFHPLKLLLGIVRITTCGCFLVTAGWCALTCHTSVSAGGLAGICSWVTTYPQDVIKSRVQGDGWGRHQRYHGPRHCLRVSWSLQFSLTLQCFVQETIKEGGWKILYRGFGSTTYRAFIVNGVILLVYNNIMRYYA